GIVCKNQEQSTGERLGKLIGLLAINRERLGKLIGLQAINDAMALILHMSAKHYSCRGHSFDRAAA
ncbi:hypothetical protein ACLOJK_008993, partial [Asimina triloba]